MSDLGRELALLANNAEMTDRTRAEAKRLAVAVDDKLIGFENALRTTETELVTLLPRLSGSAAKNVTALLALVRVVLK